MGSLLVSETTRSWILTGNWCIWILSSRTSVARPQPTCRICKIGTRNWVARTLGAVVCRWTVARASNICQTSLTTVTSLSTWYNNSIGAIEPSRTNSLWLSSCSISIPTYRIMSPSHLLGIWCSGWTKPPYMTTLVLISLQLRSPRPNSKIRSFWLRFQIRRTIIPRSTCPATFTGV